MSAAMMRAAALLAVGRGVQRLAGLVEYGAPEFRLRASKAAMTLSEMLAPCSIAGTSTSTIDDEPQSHILVVGTHELENASALIHAAERITEQYAGIRETVPVSLGAVFADHDDEVW